MASQYQQMANYNKSAAQSGNSNTAQAGNSNIRGSWLSDAAKKAGNWFEENVTSPVVQNVVNPVAKAVDENIGQPLTQGVKGIKRATGLETTPIPDSVKPTVDPNKSAAMATYGGMIQDQAGQFNPQAYGPNYFQPNTYNPQVTQNQVGMPGQYNQVSAPTTPGQVAAPNMQNVSGQTPNMVDYTNFNNPNITGQQAVISQEMDRLSNPYEAIAGYDPEMRQNYVDLATSGLEQQKTEALARLKEEQMKAGNYGSSVGQKAVQDLIQNYDQQVINAGKEADTMQMEASREDRYANINADLSRVGALSSLAGQGAGLEFSESGYNRDTAQLQNDVELIKAQYQREGKQIDNDTAMKIAQFNQSAGQQDYVNQMAGAEFTSGQAQTGLANDWKQYLAGQEEAATSDATANQAQLFNIGQEDTADLRNYGTYQDVLKGLSSYGSDAIDPQSMFDYQLYQQQQQDAANRFGSTIGTAAKIYGAL